MTYMGKMQGGAVIFEGDEKPEEGSTVKVETVDPKETKKDNRPIGQVLQDLAGIIKDGPSDGSVNVDHYLYGLPKK